MYSCSKHTLVFDPTSYFLLVHSILIHNRFGHQNILDKDKLIAVCISQTKRQSWVVFICTFLNELKLSTNYNKNKL